MAFELPELPFNSAALVPIMSIETIEYHHGKHHQAYVNNLNTLIRGTEFEKADIETIIRKADGGIFNNAAQVWNHTFFFEAFSKSGKKEPAGALYDAIINSFGSMDSFREQFTRAAVTLFGSGWAWLVKNDNRLEILQESNAGNPLKKDLIPLLTCDVWEHAYYIDYRNRRPDYVKAFWEIINWEIVERRFIKKAK